MKIVIATGIFVPEIGGPATYAPKIAKEFLDLGNKVKIITYSEEKNYQEDKNFPYQVIRIKRGNKFFNYWRYYQALKKHAKNADIVYAFDHFSAGLPSALFSKKYKKHFYIRVGGDFIWERYLDIRGGLATLRSFYQKGLYKKYENTRFKIIQWVFHQAKGIIFTTPFQRDIFQKYYNLSPAKLYIISNPIEVPTEKMVRSKINKEIIFAGRFINKNNIKNTIQSFSELENKNFSLVLIGEGPQKKELEKIIKNNNFSNIKIEPKVSRRELKKRFQRAYLVIFPSLTDISPNTMLECLSINTPFISTTEIGFDWLKDKIVMFDPLRPQAITAAIEKLLDTENYKNYSRIIEDLDYNYSYTQAAGDTLRIFNS